VLLLPFADHDAASPRKSTSIVTNSELATTARTPDGCSTSLGELVVSGRRAQQAGERAPADIALPCASVEANRRVLQASVRAIAR
jgi:hypothetical protein